MLPIKENYLAKIVQWIWVRAGLNVISGLFLILLLFLSGCGVSIEGPDVGSPSVVDFFPRKNSVDVRVDAEIRVTFSEEMAVDSINSSSFIVSGDENVPGTFHVANNIVTFTPSGSLSPGKTYTVIVKKTVTDLVGNQMKEFDGWTFSTGIKLDRLPPVVHRTVPASGATGVPLNTAISATFTKTLGTTSFDKVQLRKGASTESIIGAVAYVDQTLVFYPSNDLEPNTKYVLGVEGIGLDNRALRDFSGNTANSMSWSFTTGTELDTSAPFLASVPSSDIVANDSVYVVFNEALDVATLDGNSFYLEINGQKIHGKVKYFDKQIIFIPTAPLLEGNYDIVARTSIKDLAGNLLSDEYRQSVRVVTSQNDSEFDASASDLVLIPTRDSSIVSANSAISVTFTKEMLRPDSVHAQAITVTENNSLQLVAGEVSLVNGKGMKFAPVSPLKNNQAYTVSVSGVMDLAGNSLLNPIAWSFNTVNIPDITAPVIETRSPIINAEQISTNQSVSIVFDEVLNATGIDEQAFSLTSMEGNIPVAGTVTHVNRSIVFTPSLPLTPQTAYVVIVKAASIVDLSGNELSDDISWQFTTALEADLTAPAVLLSNSYPLDQSTNIGVIGLTITVQFSEVINASSILQVGALQVSMEGGAVLPGTVTVDGSKAIFTPEARLNYNESYQVVVNKNVADLAGNILGSPVSWVFSTKNDIDAPTIEAHLPSSNASDVKVSDIIINANFSEVMAVDTITDQSFYLTNAGELVTVSVSYEGTTAVLKPATDLDYATEYQVTLTTEILDLVGNSLAENGQWQFTTEPQADDEAPTVQSTNPTADGNDVAIDITSIDIQLSEAIDPASVTTERFIVKVVDGDVIQGQVSVNANTVSFQPTSDLMFNTSYQVELSADIADLVGNVLSASYTFTFVTNVAPPTVGSMLPNDGAADIVANGAEISVTFSEEMASASMTLDSFTVRKQGGEKIAGEVIYASRKARFVPAQPLAFNASYTVELSTQITDLAGNPLSDSVVWSFTVQANPDKEPPNLVSFTPFLGAKDVEISSNIIVIFTETMNPNSIDSESFIVTSGSAEKVTGFYSYENNTATFDPASDFPLGSRITVVLTRDITDEAGNGLANSFTWSFDTKASADTTLPTIQGLLLPAKKQQNVVITDPIIRVEFSEVMDENTINAQTVTLTSPQGTVGGSVTYHNESATFTVTDSLAYDTAYTATVTRGVKDLAQNALAQDFVWSFHTEKEQTSPTVFETIPAPSATDVSLAAVIDVTFSEAMDTSTIHIGSFVLTEGVNSVAGAVTSIPESAKAQFKPETELLPEATYTVRLTGAMTDVAGNALAEMQWSFTTKASDPNAAKEITVPHLGVVNAGVASFQRYGIKNLAAGQHIVSLSRLDNDVDLHVYDQDFAEKLCSSELPGRLADFCVANTSNQSLYLEVQNANDSGDSAYTVFAQPLASIATALPKDNDTVKAGGIKFYRVTNELPQDVIIRQWDRQGNANLYVYSDLNEEALCSRDQGVARKSNYCAISTIGLSNVFVVIDGSQVSADTVYSLSLERWQVISVNSTSGSVGEDANFYVLDNLVSGVNYKVELSNMPGLNGSIAIELNADINAISGNSCSSGNNVSAPSCPAVANGAGELYLVVDGYQSRGTDFDLTISPVE